MKKKDVLVIIGIVGIACVLFLVQYVQSLNDANGVEVMVNGRQYGTYSLKKDQTVSIDSSNKLKISDGQVEMIWADCKNQICVSHTPISKNGQTITCLPNQVVVRIINNEKSDVDAVAQ